MKPIATNPDTLDQDAIVHAWRAGQLHRQGLSRELAETFADLVDWHAIADLVQRGCPALIALRIAR